AALADRETVQLRVGDTAIIRLDAFPGKDFTGRISEVGGAAQVENGLFPLEVKFNSVSENLVSGLVAQLSIQPQQATAQSLLYVPTGAVVSGVGQRANVFVLSNDSGNTVARKREVSVAFFARDQVAINSGVQADEQVITDGALYLSDGEHVAVQSSVDTASQARTQISTPAGTAP
ncbi:MAG: hypothetical protein ABUL58_08180, partial [Steroidobacter sp.]